MASKTKNVPPNFFFLLVRHSIDTGARIHNGGQSLVGGRSRGSALLRLGTHYHTTTSYLVLNSTTDDGSPSSWGGAAQPRCSAAVLSKKNAHYLTGTLRFERKTSNGLAFNVGRLFSAHTHTHQKELHTHTRSDAGGEESSSAILTHALTLSRHTRTSTDLQAPPMTTTLINTVT